MYKRFSLFAGIIIIGLVFLVSAVDVYKDQDYIDGINVSALTWHDFNCNLTGEPPYYYKENDWIVTHYTCYDIDKVNETTYHIFDGDFVAGMPLQWGRDCMQVYNATYCESWYWWSVQRQAKDALTYIKAKILGWQTDESEYWQGYENPFE